MQFACVLMKSCQPMCSVTQKNDILTWQEVLGVSKDATKVEIKKAYHRVRLDAAQVLRLTYTMPEIMRIHLSACHRYGS